MAETASHVKKSQIVEELKERMLSSRVVGLANISGIPAPQMQSIRAKLRGKAEMRVVKNRLLLRALEAAAAERKGIEGLEDYVEGQVVLVLTESNPFRLFRELEATKTKAPAKGGEIAPGDIVVNEGSTPFKPGPVVGDLQKAGIPAAIERGKVVIKKDKVVVEEGKPIPRDVAKALTRLEIFPLTVGLDLRGVMEERTLFTRDVLSVDEDALRRDLVTAIQSGHGLALSLAFPTKTLLPTLLAEAHRTALALGLAARDPSPEVLPLLMSRAHSHFMTLSSRVPDVPLDEQRAPASAPDEEERSKKDQAGPPDEETETGKEKDEKGSDDEEEAVAGPS